MCRAGGTRPCVVGSMTTDGSGMTMHHCAGLARWHSQTTGVISVSDVLLTTRISMLTKDQMLDEYSVMGFALGMCVVERKSDGVRGTLDFRAEDGVRYYYNFVEVA